MVCSYFIVDETNGRVKIGKSTDPTKRLRELQTANASPLKLRLSLPNGSEGVFGEPPGSWTENALHIRFSSHHIRGEWFWLAKEIQEFIDGMIRRGA